MCFICTLGNVKVALQLTNELLQLVPFHKRAQRNKLKYEEMLGLNKNQTKKHIFETTFNETFSTENLKLYRPIDDSIPDKLQYEMLCRGEQLMPAEVESQLQCHYVTNNQPFYFIQPLKMEVAYLDPKIVVYYDVISEGEIETVKRLGQPKVL